MIYLFVILLCFCPFMVKSEIKPTDISVANYYVFRLVNGDVISGKIIDIVEGEEGLNVVVETDYSRLEFLAEDIVEVKPITQYYRFDNRYFYLPTAIGIGKNHSISAMELVFYSVGFGITDYFSAIVGRSFVPNVYSHQQLTLVNLKGSLPKIELDDVVNELHFAFGTNLAFVNDENKLLHLYFVGTSVFYKTTISASMFYKLGSKDFYVVRYGINSTEITYPDGSIGLAVGMDTKIPKFSDLHFIGEIWNSDITKPTHTTFMLGVRLCNSRFSADFGFAYSTKPIILPIMNFSWVPF